MTTPDDHVTFIEPPRAGTLYRIDSAEPLADALDEVISAVDMLLYHYSRGQVPLPEHDRNVVMDNLAKANRNLGQYRTLVAVRSPEVP